MIELLKILLAMAVAGVTLAIIVKKKEPECPV